MYAMILAAGRGERMRPLTDHRPKPLLEVAGQPLICWHLRALAQAGFHHVVINTAHLGHMIEEALKDGSDYGLKIRYSKEPEGALETAGGIAAAQPWKSDTDPFLVINGDVFSRWPLTQAHRIGQALQENAQRSPSKAPVVAHLVLVPNPPHHPSGDFALASDGRLGLRESSAGPVLTYAGIGVFLPGLFRDITPGTRTALGPLLQSAITRGQVQGQAYTGPWTDVGTPERLAELDQLLRDSEP